MRRTIDLRAIEKRAWGADVTLPRGFATLVQRARQTKMESCWFHIRGDAYETFQLTREAAKRLVPFMRLGDGGCLAWWRAEAGALPIVHFDSEGSARVIAADLDDLFLRMAQRRTRVSDLDDAETALVLGQSKGRIRPLTPYERAFAAYCASGAASRKRDRSGSGELIRKRVHRVAVQLLRDGRQRSYKLRDAWWELDLRIKRGSAGLSVEYLDSGEWHPLPDSYHGVELVTELVALCKHPSKRSYAVTINKDGLVSVDRDRELVLAAP